MELMARAVVVMKEDSSFCRFAESRTVVLLLLDARSVRIVATLLSVLAMIARARGSAVLAALRPVMMSVHFSHSADQISGSGEAKASGISGEAAIAMADSADKDRKVRREGT